MKKTLGVCYYPEQWPREVWEDDARRMSELGLTWARIGEFAWSRLEPSFTRLEFGWLDEAIDTLARAGLKVVLGTPTATPPRWMPDKHPQMFPVGADGHPRGFGSRRHYCFSHPGYREECVRIVTALAERYGKHPAVGAWQTDNEYGCHDTALSYSAAARDGFRRWLRARYADIDALNEQWGNVFWSMEYGDFEQVGLPNLTVTEPNPAHVLAFRRFSSDQVVSFNRAQTEIIRAHSDAPIIHNFTGRFGGFDHFGVGADLDIAAWDSYPLGLLASEVPATAEHRRRYARAGDPDFQAFHHDLNRAVGRGRWWVMEQQPGAVNWASYNPAPLAGMVRRWTWEAFEHGAEAVCYFRWRQARAGQEQMHAGLLLPDGSPAPAFDEVKRVALEINDAPDVVKYRGDAAIVFDFDADFAWGVQPCGAGLDYFGLVFGFYRVLRKLGLKADILPATARDFSGYRVVVAPGLVCMGDELKDALRGSGVPVIFGPRSGARDDEMRIPVPLPPALAGFDVKVAGVETLPFDLPVGVRGGGFIEGYREFLETTADVIAADDDGNAVAVRDGDLCYLAARLDTLALKNILKQLL